MNSKIKNAWGDGRDADVRDHECEGRPCLHIAEDKGSYSVGRGYTSYYKNPQLCCMTRHVRGCPQPIPEVDIEQLRCCPNPDFPSPRKGKRPPAYQRCRTCRTRKPGWVVDLLREVTKYPASKCGHVAAEATNWACEPCWRCPTCKQWWDKKPSPHQAGEARDAFSTRRMAEWEKRNGIPA